MIPWTSLPAPIVLAAIFLLRSVDLALSTLRMLAVVRGRRAAAWLFGFTEAMLFVSAISGVLSALQNPLSLLTFAAAFATGNVAGITIERRLAPGRLLLRIFTPGSGVAVASALHDAGVGATRIPSGRPGGGDLILCYAPRREAVRLRDVALSAEPACAITQQNVHSLVGGWRA